MQMNFGDSWESVLSSVLTWTTAKRRKLFEPCLYAWKFQGLKILQRRLTCKRSFLTFNDSSLEISDEISEAKQI